MPKARQINEEKGDRNERYASVRSIAESNSRIDCQMQRSGRTEGMCQTNYELT